MLTASGVFPVPSFTVLFFLLTACGTGVIHRSDCQDLKGPKPDYCLDKASADGGSGDAPVGTASNPEDNFNMLNDDGKAMALYCQQLPQESSARRHTMQMMLQVVDASDCIDGAKKLSQLDKIDLSSRQLIDLEPLQSLKGLKEITLHSNRIQHVAPLANLPQVHTINLNNNQISDVKPLAKLHGLHTLMINTNLLADVDGFKDFNALKNLQAKNNLIRDVGPLANKIELKTVDLERNVIEDIQELKTLTTANRIDGRLNPIEDQTCPVGPANGNICLFSPLLDLWQADEVIKKYRTATKVSVRENAGRSLLAKFKIFSSALQHDILDASLHHLRQETAEEVLLIATQAVVSYGDLKDHNIQTLVLKMLQSPAPRLRVLAMDGLLRKITRHDLHPSALPMFDAYLTNAQSDASANYQITRLLTDNLDSMDFVNTNLSPAAACQTVWSASKFSAVDDASAHTIFGVALRLQRSHTQSCCSQWTNFVRDSSIHVDMRAATLSALNIDLAQCPTLTQALLALPRDNSKLYSAALDRLAPLAGNIAEIRHAFLLRLQSNPISAFERVALNFGLGLSVDEFFAAQPVFTSETHLASILDAAVQAPRIFSATSLARTIHTLGANFSQIEQVIGIFSANSLRRLTGFDPMIEHVLSYIPAYDARELQLIHVIRFLAIDGCNEYAPFCPTRERIHQFPGHQELQETIAYRDELQSRQPSHPAIAIFNELIKRMNELYSMEFDYTARRSVLASSVQAVFDPFFAQLPQQTLATTSAALASLDQLMQERQSHIHWLTQEAIPTTALKQFLLWSIKQKVRAITIKNLSVQEATALLGQLLQGSLNTRLLRPVYHRRLLANLPTYATRTDWQVAMSTDIEQGIKWQLDDLYKNVEVQVQAPAGTISTAMQGFYQEIVRVSLLAEWDYLLQGLKP